MGLGLIYVMKINYGCRDLNRMCRSCCKSVSLIVICVSRWVFFFSCHYAWKQLTIRGILEGWRNCTKWIIFTVECDTALIQMIHCAADTILQLSGLQLLWFPWFPPICSCPSLSHMDALSGAFCIFSRCARSLLALLAGTVHECISLA